MKWAIYALGALGLVGGLIFAGYFMMPEKASWAEEFTEYSRSLPEDDPLRKQLQPMLSDGKLSLWELSQLHCQFETGCTVDSFVFTYANPEASDMFAAMALEILKAQRFQRADSQQ
jgi:hypothetical protein